MVKLLNAKKPQEPFKFLVSEEKMIGLRAELEIAKLPQIYGRFVREFVYFLKKEASQKFQAFFPFLVGSSPYLENIVGFKKLMKQFCSRISQQPIKDKLEFIKKRIEDSRKRKDQMESYLDNTDDALNTIKNYAYFTCQDFQSFQSVLASIAP